MSAEELRNRRIGAFLTLAREEMKAAEMLRDSLPRQSAFFQQQAAEKLLRAVLEVEQIPAGPTHNLRTLTDLLPSDHVMRSEFLAMESLSSAATRFRYPGGYGDAPRVDSELLKDRESKVSALRAVIESFINQATGHKS